MNIIRPGLSQRVKLKIADFILEAYCAEPGIGLKVHEVNQRFVVEDGQVDCVLNVHYCHLPDIKLEEPVFDSERGPFKLFRSDNKLVMQLVGMIGGQDYIHGLLVLEPDLSRGELFIRPESELPDIARQTPEKERKEWDPFFHPIDAFLVNNLLALKKGTNVHAAGVISEGRGLVFCGEPGTGKSTIATLWKERQATVLSDERVALRRRDDFIYAYGTPWQSSARLFCPDRAPLEAVYFLKHARENRMLSLDALDAATRLVLCSSTPYYIRDSLERSLEFIDALVQAIPCFELQFTPDQRAVDAVLDHVKHLKP